MQLISRHIPNIRSASREIIRQFGLLNNRFLNLGTSSQCHAMIELDAHKVMTLGELAVTLNLEKSTTSRLVAQMESKKLCNVQPDEHDRRNKLITLTEKGRSSVKIIHTEANNQVLKALEMMTIDEQSAVVHGLSIYAKALKRSHLQSQYTIRNLTEKDIPQLIKLTKTIWAEFGFDDNHPDAYFFEAELNKTYEIYSAKKSGYFVLLHGKKIVGGAGYAPLEGERDVCELKGMYLSNQLRGLGLGTLLLQHVLKTAKNIGFKECYLETMSFMQGANALYKKIGFNPLDKPKGKTGHSWTNCWYMREL